MQKVALPHFLHHLRTIFYNFSIGEFIRQTEKKLKIKRHLKF